MSEEESEEEVEWSLYDGEQWMRDNEEEDEEK